MPAEEKVERCGVQLYVCGRESKEQVCSSSTGGGVERVELYGAGRHCGIVCSINGCVRREWRWTAPE